MINNKYIAACEILRGTGLDIVDAARLIKEAVEVCGPGLGRIREGIRLAGREIKRREMTVPFGLAVDSCLAFKAHRRPRTRADIRQFTSRMMRLVSGLADSPLRSLSSQDCTNILERCFPTPRQRIKARAILSGIFALGCRRGWVSSNPVARVDCPVIEENRVFALDPAQVTRLLHASQNGEQGTCAAAVGLMLYAGIRPHEVERLRWKDISLNERVISIQPRHSKTGGARHVTVQPVLLTWLKSCMTAFHPMPDDLICPKNWRIKWRRIRRLAGWETWQQDCLRHTYASYHAKHFKDLSLLQLEMGHGTLALLRTRYLNMQGVTAAGASAFWNKSGCHPLVTAKGAIPA